MEVGNRKSSTFHFNMIWIFENTADLGLLNIPNMGLGLLIIMWVSLLQHVFMWIESYWSVHISIRPTYFKKCSIVHSLYIQ